MKKLILIAIIAFSITSCRKERVCECKTTRTSVITEDGAQTTVITNSSDKTTKEKQLKRDFKYGSNCFSQSRTDYASGGPPTDPWSSQTLVETTCEIK